MKKKIEIIDVDTSGKPNLNGEGVAEGADTAKRILQQRVFSRKINYAALDHLFDT